MQLRDDAPQVLRPPRPRTLQPPPARPLVPAGPDDRFFDYCLQPYRPRAKLNGKVRAEGALWYALQLAGILEQAEPPLRALQSLLGRDQTVWGAKWDGQRWFFELYIYDPQQAEPASRLGPLAEALAPWVRVVPQVAPHVPYMMVSLDLDAEILRAGVLEEVTLYLSGTALHEGRSYKLRAGQPPELDNYYRFLAPKPEIDELLALLTTSAHVDYAKPQTLAQVLIPELFACRRICVAKKRWRDGIYFSGLDVDQLLFALRRLQWPAPMTAYVAHHAEAFEHLQWDVGVDCEQRPDGSIGYVKSSFYGTL